MEEGVRMHLLNFKGLSSRELVQLVDTALAIKSHPKRYVKVLEGKTAALVFQKTSTRTRVSFEVAMTQLGGQGLFLDWKTTNFAMSDLSDEIGYLSRNVDCIMARMLYNSDLNRIAEASRVPVINGCDEKYHPSQVIADLITMKELKGTLSGVKLVYVGVHNNVANSLIEACVKLGVKITTVCPVFNEASRDNELLSVAEKSGFWESTLDLAGAVLGADFVYTDTWVDMEFFTDPKYVSEKEKRVELMMPYQINVNLLKNTDAYIMHDMPIHRDYEITADAIESPRSVIYRQAENRLYSAKAILLKLIKA